VILLDRTTAHGKSMSTTALSLQEYSHGPNVETVGRREEAQYDDDAQCAMGGQM